MGKFTRRGSLALAAAVAVVVAGAGVAVAAPVIPDTKTATADAVTRLAGADRIETAIAASVAQYPNATGTTFAGTQPTHVIVVRSDDYPDALTAAPLAKKFQAPVLITPSGSDLDPKVVAEIQRLRPTGGAYIVGGSGAVSNAAAATLDSIVGDVTRLDGIDRYETSVAVANAVLGASTDVTRATAQVFLTTGLDFADALSAGAAAANTTNGVVLLTKGNAFDGSTGNAWGQATTTSQTLDFIFAPDTADADGDGNKSELTIPVVPATRVFAIGGPSAAAVGSGINAANKVVGADRYETASKAATKFFGTPNQFAVANGLAYADAVVAAGFIGNQEGPLLLTRSNELPAVTSSYVAKASAANDSGPENTAAEFDDVYVFGGEAIVSASVATALGTAIAPNTAAPVISGVSFTNGIISGTTKPNATVTLSYKAGVTGPGAGTVVTANSSGAFQIVLQGAAFPWEAGKSYSAGDLILTAFDGTRTATANVAAFAVPDADVEAYSATTLGLVTGSVPAGANNVKLVVQRGGATTQELTVTVSGTRFSAPAPTGVAANDVLVLTFDLGGITVVAAETVVA